MATAAGKTQCITCGKEKATYICRGCSKDYCINHLTEHHQLLGKQLDDIENQRNLFRQTLTDQTTNPQKHLLVQQINLWEKKSINKIRETAQEARESVLKHSNKHIGKIEIKLTEFTQQLKEIRQENDFNEIHLKQLNKKLQQLEEQLNKPSNISIEEDSSSFVNKLSVIISPTSLFTPKIDINVKWVQNGITVAGGNGKGNGLNQLSNPYGAYIDGDQTIYVADYSNCRIVEWKSGAMNGQVVAGGNEPGNRNNQLNGPTNVIVDKASDSLLICDYGNKRALRWPRRNGTGGEIIISNIDCHGLVIDNDGYLYVSDNIKQEVRRRKIGDTDGTVVAGGNGQGNRLDQLSGPYFIFVDQDHSVYVSDCSNHRIMKWLKDAKEGIVVVGGQGQGNGMTQLSRPHGITVDQLGTIYVADHGNHRVMRWFKGATEGSVVVGGNGQGGQANQLNYPFDLSFDRQNNLYIVDYYNHRIQKFPFHTL